MEVVHIYLLLACFNKQDHEHWPPPYSKIKILDPFKGVRYSKQKYRLLSHWSKQYFAHFDQWLRGSVAYWNFGTIFEFLGNFCFGMHLLILK